MEIITKDIKDLMPYEKNPRHNTEAIKYVADSIREFGFKNPIIIDKDNVVVCGHTRLLACKKLGLKEVPCIIADDLNEEQVKAFRLADNKVAEYSEWDMGLLSEELENILNIDMSDFGFESIAEDLEFKNEIKQNERVRTANAYNLDLLDIEYTDGFYQMPIIECDNFIPKDIISFNYAKSSEKHDCGIHFFIDDYQFERVWNTPYDYIDILSQYECILSPDFSLYTDMPMAMKIWNVYRSRLIGQYYQQCGIKVIPTISWCEKETFEFCFDGIPKKSIVAISTIGVKQDESAMQIWKDGVDEMIKRIQPKAIIVYGGKINYDYGKTKVIYFDNANIERMKGIGNED